VIFLHSIAGCNNEGLERSMKTDPSDTVNNIIQKLYGRLYMKLAANCYTVFLNFVFK
jgi:CRISPR/Cas system-associated endonuclease Cas1